VSAQARTAAISADELTAVALLNCLIRELAGPRGKVLVSWPHALITLTSTGRTIRIGLRRPSLGELRPTGRVEWSDGAGGWFPLSWDQVADAVGSELAAGSGYWNPRLISEITASHAFVSAVLRRRTEPDQLEADHETGLEFNSTADYLASEQSLIAGHRFHPAPKARSGSLVEALRYAPEARSQFRLRYLAVPEELLWQYEAQPGAAEVFDRGQPPPAGHQLLPVHPWQYRILLRGNALPAALSSGRLIDLGELGDPVRPTSSVRTVVEADGSGFLKLSLAVQITNCLRVNPLHEMHAAVALTGLLGPVRTELAELFPGTLILGEPACRTAQLGLTGDGDDLAAGLGVIAREGLADRLPDGVRPLLAAALVEPLPDPAVAGLLDLVCADRDELIEWWDGYLARLLPPVLHAFLAHGVVFEAHLQNVVIGLCATSGRANHVVLRDLEGVKLVGPRHSTALALLPPGVRDHLDHSAERGWNRVAYCLFVNHIGGVLGTLADRRPGAERWLWSRVRSAIQSFRREHGDAPQLRAVLAGTPLPAKTNLLTRWHDDADRDSGYVPVSLPLG
jgi:siderophore synthetase component